MTQFDAVEEEYNPLWLPKGSIRSLIVLGIVAATLFMWVTGRPVPDGLALLNAGAVAAYFVSKVPVGNLLNQSGAVQPQLQQLHKTIEASRQVSAMEQVGTEQRLSGIMRQLEELPDLLEQARARNSLDKAAAVSPRLDDVREWAKEMSEERPPH